jgi:hypothetical protein
VQKEVNAVKQLWADMAELEKPFTLFVSKIVKKINKK